MNQLPDMLFVVDPVKERIAVAEANKLEIPVIAICDTNSDPDPIDYPVPGNDDAIRAIRLLAERFAEAITEGRAVWETTRRERSVEEEHRAPGAPQSVADRVRAREARRERTRQKAHRTRRPGPGSGPRGGDATGGPSSTD